MKDGEMQAASVFGTIVLSAALFVPAVFLSGTAVAKKSDAMQMEAIEASVAYKKTPMKQPQKKMQAPQPVDKPEGVSHDEKKPVEPKKPDEPKKPPPKPDNTDPLAKFKHPTDDDQPTGKPTTEIGDFNGNERGWASETKGSPYFQKFAQDIHDNFSLPTISDASGTPVGCFHITADGKVVDTKFEANGGGPDVTRAAQDAIDAVKKVRNDNPVQVPTELLSQINRWICFRFNPNGAH